MNLIASILFDCGFTIRKGLDYCDTQTFVVNSEIYFDEKYLGDI